MKRRCRRGTVLCFLQKSYIVQIVVMLENETFQRFPFLHSTFGLRRKTLYCKFCTQWCEKRNRESWVWPIKHNEETTYHQGRDFSPDIFLSTSNLHTVISTIYYCTKTNNFQTKSRYICLDKKNCICYVNC